MKKIILLTFLVFLAITLKLSFFSKTSITEVAELLASSRSKEFCSCYFILKNSEKYCLDQVLKGYPLFDYKIMKNSVSFSNPLYSSTSEVSENTKFGCRFIN